MSVKYGKLIINNKSTQLDRLFTYIIDEDLIDSIEVGMRVLVPFGRGNKVITALLVEILDENDSKYKMKKIIDVLDDKPLISKSLLDLGFWMKDRYLASYLDSFQPILPPGDFKEVSSFIELEDLSYRSNSIQEERIVHYLKNKGIVQLQELKDRLNINKINNHLKELEEKNVISISIDVNTRIKIKTERWVKLKDLDLDQESMEGLIEKRFHKQRSIANYLMERKDISLKDLIREVNTSLQTVKELEKKEVLEIYEKPIHRNPIKRKVAFYGKHDLSSNQKKVFNTIAKAIKSQSNKRNYLIHGVTGSGKTEIYLQLVEEVFKMNKSAIILVPEISLTPQTIERFVGRFGKDVAILHSRLSQGERFDQWRKIKEGKVSIVVGARSAIFAPFKNLGLIVIDEEHETSYKSSQNPKYDTIEVAKQRAELEKAYLVLGTATPSMETYYQAKNLDLKLLKLDERINKNQLPNISVVDMREELKLGNKTIFSQELLGKMTETLNKDKQIILFLNRRGFSTFVTCRECGYVAKCKDCEISLTYYKSINKLRCHYCGQTENIPTLCPLCGSRYIKDFGIGTEKVEEYTRQVFPHARIARMDSDTTSSKESHEEILNLVKNKEVDILIGTQMIAKGLDFEDVTLVGIVAGDTSLNLPDFRSAERTFQLITQVAGRAGRGRHEGSVVLQTYNPDHYSIVEAREQNYENFYNSEIALRKEFLYPPFVNIISILVYGSNRTRVGKLSKEIYNIIGREVYKIYGEDYRNYISEPNPAPIEKIQKNFRWMIIIKLENKDLQTIKDLIRKVCLLNEYKLDMDNLKISIELNPNTII